MISKEVNEMKNHFIEQARETSSFYSFSVVSDSYVGSRMCVSTSNAVQI